MTGDDHVVVLGEDYSLEMRKPMGEVLVEQGLAARVNDEFLSSNAERDALLRAIEARADLAVCDFCSDSYVEWRNPCKDFSISIGPEQERGSAQSWASCGACQALIVAGKRDALATRSIKSASERSSLSIPVNNPDLLEFVRGVHDDFWRNRTGAAERVQPERA